MTGNVISIDPKATEATKMALEIVGSFRDMQASVENQMLEQINIFEAYSSLVIESIEIVRDINGRAIRLDSIAKI